MIKAAIQLSLVTATISLSLFAKSDSAFARQTLNAPQQYGGGEIAYNEDIPNPTPGYVAERRIGIVDINGSNARQITTNQFQFEHFDRAPHWSPNGKYIAFDSESDVSPLSLTNSAVQDTLYVLEIATGKIIAVGKGLYTFTIIIWRPDSKALAYETQEENSSPAIYKVHIVNIDGTNDQIFLNAAPDVSISNPSWSSDGKYFLFYAHSYESNAQSSEGSWIVSNAGGSNQHRVATSGKGVDWYPVGTALAVDDNEGHLQIIDALNGTVENTLNNSPYARWGKIGA